MSPQSRYRSTANLLAQDGELHVLYAFTPVQAAQTCINWQIFRSEVERLDESNLRALGFIGLKPSIINKMYVLIIRLIEFLYATEQ
jgi:DNA polymerase theta